MAHVHIKKADLTFSQAGMDNWGPLFILLGMAYSLSDH